jgi:signal transduction histidine kinase
VIRWIQRRPWLAPALLSASAFLVLGGIDLLLQGELALLVAALFAGVILFAVRLPGFSVAIIFLATGIQILLGLTPLASSVSAAFGLLVLAAFAPALWRRLAFAAGLVAGVTIVIYESATVAYGFSIYGLGLDDFAGRVTLAVLGSGLVIAVNALAFLGGRLLITRVTHVGTSYDRAVADRQQSRLNLEIAEQNERFQIARDINEIIIQRVAAVISQAEGGLYAAKADPSSATRSLENLAGSARSAHTELRRLYDMLNKTHSVTAAPPGIDELEQLVIAYREFGYSVNLRHDGKRFELDEGAELAVHRIVYEALENIRVHVPSGASISIDFSWVEPGLQVLVKDNGIEYRNRQLAASGQDTSYGVEEDLRALTQPVVGASISAMRERAALYGGTIEATRVPGVGFTISAIFADLHPKA